MPINKDELEKEIRERINWLGDANIDLKTKHIARSNYYVALATLATTKEAPKGQPLTLSMSKQQFLDSLTIKETLYIDDDDDSY